MIEFNDRRKTDAAPARGTIAHAKARDVASKFSGTSGSLRELANSGRVTADVANDAAKAAQYTTKKTEQKYLGQLARYANKNSGRGPVNDWQHL
jgi:hypothetical protein